MGKLLAPWQGEHTNCVLRSVEARIDEAKASHVNSDFGWYVNIFSRWMTRHASEEGRTPFSYDLKVKSLSVFVHNFVETTSISLLDHVDRCTTE